MLHQLLFALIGKPGNIIKLTNENMKIEFENKILYESQTKLINSMTTLGFYFCNIEEFIKNICTSWMESKTNNEDEQNNKSVYLRAFCSGLNEILEEYKLLLIQFEKDFLENRFFTYAGIHAELGKYYILLPEIWSIITKIQDENLRGGLILELLYAKVNSSTVWVKDYYTLLFDKCYSVMFNQISSWILYGKLLDMYDEFFIHKFELSNSNKNQKDWDSMYTLQINMIPLSIVSHQIAEKILFIGKGSIILRIINKQLSKLPNANLVLNVTKLKNFNIYNFNTVVEQIRYNIASELVELVMKKQNLIKELQSLKEYYLMGKGEFFYTFLEESKNILSLPYSKIAQHNLNNVCLPNTFLRIGEEINPKLSLEVKQNGFVYKDFSSTVNLTILGNVSVRPSNYLKFQPVKNYGGSLWHNMKQPVESGFTTRFAYRFKKTIYGSMVSLNATLPSSRHKTQNTSSTSICYVIQNSNEISSWKKNAPISLQQVQQCICIRIGMQQTAKRGQGKSFITLSYLNQNQQRVLDRIECKRNSMKQKGYFDFAEQDFQQLKISYSNDVFKVSIQEGNEESGVLAHIKLNKMLGLDMGRAYMGFLQSSFNSCYSVDIVRWEVLGINAFNTSDYWGDLTIGYEIRWPINLILSNQLMEKYQQIFRMFFPIRLTQIELDNLWLKLQRRSKNAKKGIYKIIMNFCSFRSQLSIAINAIWSCFQKDVVDYQWDKLKLFLQTLDDFQKLRMNLDTYIKSIQNMCFLTTPKVLHSIFDIIRCAKSFIHLNTQMEAQQEVMIQKYYKHFVEIKKKYEQAYRILVQQLTTLFNTSNSYHINQLLLKLDFNGYYLDKKIIMNY